MFSCNENHCAKYVYYAANAYALVCFECFSTYLSEMQIGSNARIRMIDSVDGCCAQYTVLDITDWSSNVPLLCYAFCSWKCLRRHMLIVTHNGRTGGTINIFSAIVDRVAYLRLDRS